MSIVAALDKVLFFNASSKYSVLRMKTEDSSVPTEARSPYRYHDHLIRFTAVGIELPQTDSLIAHNARFINEGKTTLYYRAIRKIKKFIVESEKGGEVSR